MKNNISYFGILIVLFLLISISINSNVLGFGSCKMECEGPEECYGDLYSDTRCVASRQKDGSWKMYCIQQYPHNCNYEYAENCCIFEEDCTWTSPDK